MVRSTPFRIKFEYVIALAIVFLAVSGIFVRFFLSQTIENNFRRNIRELENRFQNVYTSEHIRYLSHNINVHSVNYFLTGDEEERQSLIKNKEEFYRTFENFKQSYLLTHHEEKELIKILEKAQDEKFEVLKTNMNRPLKEKVSIILGPEVENYNIVIRENLQKLIDIEVNKYRRARSSLIGLRNDLIENVTTVSIMIFIMTLFLAYILYRISRKLRIAHAETLEAVRARDDIMAIVSHDLKNPVSAVSLNVQMLLRKTVDQPHLKKNLESIQNSMRLMMKLIQDILDYNKLEANKLELEMKEENFKSIVEEAEEVFIPQASKKSIEIINILPKKIPVVRCDKLRLIQVLSNLLSNAIKFSGEGTKVELKVEAREDELLVEVHDEGPGIPPDELEHIFDRYWQAKKTAKMGTGLGLSIAEKLVRAHGGIIWAKSLKNKGTTFSFTVPLST